MAHLVEYENATTEVGKALAAIDCSRAKSARARAWNWAEIAAEHARAAGIENAVTLLGGGRWPEFEPLKAALQEMAAANQIETVV